MKNSQSEIRAAAQSARKQMSAAKRKAASQIIADKVTSSAIFCAAKAVGCYLSLGFEVDTRTVIERAWQKNLRIFVPVVQKSRTLKFREVTESCRMKRNSLGIREPVDTPEIDSRELDLVITPLVAFDPARNRIGMGGGYYDREFAYLAGGAADARPQLHGVAFDCQKVEKIAPNPWDIRLFRIYTESCDY